MTRIGVDFGGTKIEAAAVDAQGRFLARRREPNPGNYPAALATVARLVTTLEQETQPVAAVGVGIPGSLSPVTGHVRNANSTWLNDQPLLKDLEVALARPVRLANDANCMALSEAVDGSGAGARVVFAAILGTGAGAGLVVDGHLLQGLNGVAGEWGHTPLPWAQDAELPVNRCWCGRRGCLETYVSGTALGADYRRATGVTATGAEVIEAMRKGDTAAAAAFGRLVDRLGRALAVVGDLLDPDVIVLAGGLSNVDELYGRLEPVMAEHLFSDVCNTPIVKAKHGDSSGVRGAAWLWPLAPRLPDPGP